MTMATHIYSGNVDLAMADVQIRTQAMLDKIRGLLLDLPAPETDELSWMDVRTCCEVLNQLSSVLDFLEGAEGFGT